MAEVGKEVQMDGEVEVQNGVSWWPGCYNCESPPECRSTTCL